MIPVPLFVATEVTPAAPLYAKALQYPLYLTYGTESLPIIITKVSPAFVRLDVSFVDNPIPFTNLVFDEVGAYCDCPKK